MARQLIIANIIKQMDYSDAPIKVTCTSPQDAANFIRAFRHALAKQGHNGITLRKDKAVVTIEAPQPEVIKVEQTNEIL